MKCSYHPEIEAVTVCSTCGRAICQSCTVDVAGRFTCKNCVSTGKVPRVQPQKSNPMNPLAIASLILGILGLCMGIPSPVAWILGNSALKQIQENPNQDGMQLAKVGKTLGMVVTILYGAAISCYIILMFSIPILNQFQ